MDNKIEKLSKLKNLMLETGYDDIYNLEPTINQILEDVFGIGNQYVKKAHQLQYGFISLSSSSEISTEQLKKEKFEEYMNLLVQAEAYVRISSGGNIDLSINNNSKSNNSKTIFLSYCWEDATVANEIDDFLISKNINVTRDIRAIENWQSIKEFMHTIRETDSSILLISDSYLKSLNCMYEVLEIMKEPQYQERIFPAVIASIYSAESRIGYVKYWEDRTKKLEGNLKSLDYTNGLALGNELKKCKEICSNIAEFLNIVSDMNNPNIDNIKEVIYDKVK